MASCKQEDFAKWYFLLFLFAGVFDQCESSYNLDHAVLVVGYGVTDGQEVWIVKNSWGTDWGEDGYFLLPRNAGNQCGVATEAAYPLV